MFFDKERRGVVRDGWDGLATRRTHPPRQEDLKAYLAAFGVDWSDGSSVQSMAAIGKLLVVNTITNLCRLEAVLQVINVTRKQVEIDCQFVAIPREALEKTARFETREVGVILQVIPDVTPDGQTFTYLLVTATLVDPAGHEVRKEDPGWGTFSPVSPAVD